MKKNTLKRVGAILAGIAMMFSVSAQTTPGKYDPVAPWYNNGNGNAGKTFVEVWGNEYSAPEIGRKYLASQPRIDISEFIDLEPSTFYHLGKLNGESGLPRGMFVTYDNKEANYVTYSGDHYNVTYDNLVNMDVNTGSSFFAAGEKGGIGVYPGVNSTVAAEFIVSTKGLMNVSEIAVDINAIGNEKKVNRKYNWYGYVHIYELDGTYAGVFEYGYGLKADWVEFLGHGSYEMIRYEMEPVFEAKNSTLGKKQTIKLTTSDYPVNNAALRQGDLDNKILFFHFFTDESKPDADFQSNEITAISLFNNLKVKANHPTVAFGKEGEEKQFNAGAGRNTSCNMAELDLSFDAFNTIWSYDTPGFDPKLTWLGDYVFNVFQWRWELVDWDMEARKTDGKPDNYLTEKFAPRDIVANARYPYDYAPVDRYQFYGIDHPVGDDGKPTGKLEEISYFKLTVNYPFIADSLLCSAYVRQLGEGATATTDFTEELGFFSMEQLKAWGNIYYAETPGEDKSVTYYIPRDLLILTDGDDDHYRHSTTKVKYYFAPQEINTWTDFEAFEAVVTAEACETVTYKVNASSVPSYNEAGKMYFDKYVENQGEVPVSFTNLPYFNTHAGKKLAAVDRLLGGLTLVNKTEADKDATDRYDDDVDLIGWRIIMKDGKETYIDGKILPMAAVGMTRTDWEKKLDECYNCPPSGQYTIGEALNVKIIDCSGNINPAIKEIKPLFHYHRGDINVDDRESLFVNEIFHLAPTLVYDASYVRYNFNTNTLAGTKVKVSGADLMGNPEWYQGPIEIHGSNQMIWYDFRVNDLMTDALDLLSPFNFFNQYGHRADIYFAPFDDTVQVGHGYESRVHTVYIKATNLKPDKTGGKTATFKVYKQEFDAKGEATDDLWYHQNGFLFTASELDAERAYWKDPIIGSGVSSNAKPDVFKGTSLKDTLYFTIDLDDVALVNRVKSKGLELKVIYKPTSDNNYLARELDKALNNCYTKLPKNVFHHVGEFAISTYDKKGFNQFHVFGITDGGLVSSINADYVAGSYQAMHNFILKQFDWRNNHVSGIYREMFTKDYQTHYIGTCYPTNDSYFIIAGVNIMDPIDYIVETNNKNAFTYEIEALYDIEEVPYGEVKKSSNTKWQFKPNKYGEILLLAKVTFAPTTREGIPAEIWDYKTGVKVKDGEFEWNENKWNRYIAHDLIKIIPQQRVERGFTFDKDGNIIVDQNVKEPANRIYFFDVNDKLDSDAIVDVPDEVWLEYGVFAQFGKRFMRNYPKVDLVDDNVVDYWGKHYCPYITDTIRTAIFGDVKKPEVYFSSDYAGEKAIKAQDFKTIIAGQSSTIPVFIQGRDLPHYGTTPEGETTKVEQIIKVFSESGLLSGYLTADDAEEHDVLWNSIETAKRIADGKTYKFTAGSEGEKLYDDVLRGDVVIELPLTLTPNVADLCDINADLNMVAVCGEDFQKTLATSFVAKLQDPVIKEETSGTIGGSSYLMQWDKVPAVNHYVASIGKFNTKYKSENIFISEVYVDAEEEDLYVEFFNGTGDVINRDLLANYWLQLLVDNGGEKIDTTIVDLNNNMIQGSADPFWKQWKYDAMFKIIDISKWGLTNKENTVKYTIRLMEGVASEDPQIDIYYFNTASTWLTRRWDIEGVLPMNHGKFNIADWSTEDGSLVKGEAAFKWQDYKFFDAAGTSKELDKEAVSVLIKNLQPRTNYTVRLQAFNWCVDEPSEGLRDIPFSEWSTGDGGDIEFVGDWSGIEMNDASEVKVVGEYGKVSIMGANGKKATVTDVVGRKLGERVLNSNYESFNAPAGVVIVTVEGEATTKALVK